MWVLRDLRILPKLLLAFGWLALVSALLMGWTSYRSARAALEEATFERLTTIREARKRQIDSYFREIRAHVLTLASTPWIIQATEQLAHAFHTWPLEGPTRPPISPRLPLSPRRFFATRRRSACWLYNSPWTASMP